MSVEREYKVRGMPEILVLAVWMRFVAYMTLCYLEPFCSTEHLFQRISNAIEFRESIFQSIKR